MSCEFPLCSFSIAFLCVALCITLFYCFGAACNSSDTRASRARSNSGARACYIFGKVSCTNAHVTSCLRSGNFKELVLAASQVIVTGVQVCRVNAGGLCKRRSDPHGFGCLKGATASTVAGRACSKACSKAALTCCTNALSKTAAMFDAVAGAHYSRRTHPCSRAG